MRGLLKLVLIVSLGLSTSQAGAQISSGGRDVPREAKAPKPEKRVLVQQKAGVSSLKIMTPREFVKYFFEMMEDRAFYSDVLVIIQDVVKQRYVAAYASDLLTVLALKFPRMLKSFVDLDAVLRFLPHPREPNFISLMSYGFQDSDYEDVEFRVFELSTVSGISAPIVVVDSKLSSVEGVVHFVNGLQGYSVDEVLLIQPERPY